MSVASAKTPAEEWRAGWQIVTGSALALAAGYASFPFVSSLFIEPLASEFGWSRRSLALGQSLTILGALTAPAAGVVIDRIGVFAVARLLIPAYACVLAGLALMPGKLPLYLVLMALLAITGTGSTAIIYMREVAANFTTSRGLALGTARMGVAISGLLAPPLLYMLISAFGWRAGYAALSLLALGLCLPATIGLVCNRRRTSQLSAPATEGPALDWRRVAILALGVSGGMGPPAAILGQLQPILTSTGIEKSVAASAISAFALSVAIGAVLVGYLADRMWAPLLAVLFAMAAAIGLTILQGFHTGTPHWIVYGTITLIGIAQGAEIDLSSFLIARYFGLQQFSFIFGLFSFVLAFSVSASAYLLGAAFDRTGSYSLALYWASITILLSGIILLFLGRYPRQD